MNKLTLLVSIALGFLVAFALSCAPTARVQPEPPPQKPLPPACVDNFTPTTPSTESNDAKYLKSPYVILVSIDGYRHDYTQEYNPPHISDLAKSGVQADSLKPSFPSNTFPNHFTIISGLLPSHHGIVSNFFYDPKRDQSYSMIDGKAVNDGTWYGGTPLWRAANKQGMLSATMYWVGSEAKIDGPNATYTQSFYPQFCNITRVEKVIDWLNLPEEKRPHFITLYFSDVDSNGHKHGPKSPDVKKAVMEIDAALGKLRDYIHSSPLEINMVVVSDHGMTMKGKPIVLNDFSKRLDKFVEKKESGAFMMLYSKDKKLVEDTVTELNDNFAHNAQIRDVVHAYKREDLPGKYRFDDNERSGDLIVVAEMPYVLALKGGGTDLPGAQAAAGGNIATHGWFNDNSDMQGIFYAEGPQFSRNLTVHTFQNINVYPIVLKALGLPQSDKIDGNLSQVDPRMFR